MKQVNGMTNQITQSGDEVRRPVSYPGGYGLFAPAKCTTSSPP